MKKFISLVLFIFVNQIIARVAFQRFKKEYIINVYIFLIPKLTLKIEDQMYI